MKKHLILLSMIAALSLSGCNLSGEGSNGGGRKSGSSGNSNTSETSSSDDSSATSQPQTVDNDNFSIVMPSDVSSMSANCKQYVDDMREQQERLLDENGEDADYYLNDLFGAQGVDLTKGVAAGDNGGYRESPETDGNEYLDDPAARWEDGEKSDENKGVNISFEPSASLQGKEYTISYSVNSDMSDAKTIVTSQKAVNLKNLLVNQKYYVKISADGKDSDVAEFTTGDYPRWINARPMFNVRDHGGYLVQDGSNGAKRIKQGLVYRGGEITPVENWKSGLSYRGDTGGRYVDSSNRMQDGHITTQNADSKKAFREEMGMVNGIEIDLRSSSERNGYTSCGFAENGDIAYTLKEINSYDSPMKDANKRALIKDVFNLIAQYTSEGHAVYYHCYGGADRTGTIGFLLGAVLGMSYTDLVIDFELTSYSSNPSRNYRSHLRAGPYNYWPRMVSYLKDTLHWGTEKTIREYAEEFLVNNCSISSETIQTIRNNMLED